MRNSSRKMYVVKGDGVRSGAFRQDHDPVEESELWVVY